MPGTPEVHDAPKIRPMSPSPDLRSFQDHQADGLQAWVLPAGIRLIPLWRPASGEALRAAMACAWTLERELRAEGYDVVVLDEAGTAPKVPLAGQTSQGLLRERLRRLPGHAVVLWLAPLETLAVVLEGSPARPLVAFAPQYSSHRQVVDAYNAIKVCWQVGGLHAIVLTPGTTPARFVQALTDCCTGYLAMTPPVWALEYHDTADLSRPAWHAASVWKVLDSAWMVTGRQEPQNDPQPRECPTPDARPYSRLADVYGQRYA